MSEQISFPAGMVSHIGEWKFAYPGEELPEWAAPQTILKTLYPADQVQRGYIYVYADQAGRFRVGDPIQIDRTHTTVVRVGKAREVMDASQVGGDDLTHPMVQACRVYLGDDRTFI